MRSALLPWWKNRRPNSSSSTSMPPGVVPAGFEAYAEQDYALDYTQSKERITFYNCAIGKFGSQLQETLPRRPT